MGIDSAEGEGVPTNVRAFMPDVEFDLEQLEAELERLRRVESAAKRVWSAWLQIGERARGRVRREGHEAYLKRMLLANSLNDLYAALRGMPMVAALEPTKQFQERATCAFCKRFVALRKDGAFRVHRIQPDDPAWCEGSLRAPSEAWTAK